jgi:methylase of polypeptide subunit release factors
LSAAERPDGIHGEAALVTLGRKLRDSGYRFTTTTPLTHSRVNARTGNGWAADLAGIFGWSRPFRDGVLDESTMRLAREAGVLAPVDGGWRSTVRLSSLGDLLFFHSAFPTTAGDAVFFGPDTYRFAGAISRHLDERRDPIARAVDIGCGAGPGGLLIAASAPEAKVVLGDVNAAALRLAAVNAELNALARVDVRRSDLLDGAEGSFDLIVSNPPYLIDSAARAYRHGGGKRGEGLSLAILKAALPRLTEAGSLVLYTGSAIVDGVDGFRQGAEAVLAGTGRRWRYEEMDPDVFGEELEEAPYRDADRIAAVVLTVS